MNALPALAGEKFSLKAKPQIQRDSMERTNEGFIEQVKEDKASPGSRANSPVYLQCQWRDFEGVDQISQVMEDIQRNPDSAGTSFPPGTQRYSRNGKIRYAALPYAVSVLRRRGAAVPPVVPALC